MSDLEPIWFIECIIKTFQYTGMRRSSLVNLILNDIDLEYQNINISPENSKNHHHYQIPITKQLIPYIQKLYKEHIKLGSKRNDQFFNINLFRSNNYKNKPMSKYQLDNIFKKISQHAKFPVSPHRFRHTLATNLMKDPQNLYIAKGILGHKTVSVTMKYIHYNPNQLRSALNKHFSGKK